jgi:D-3-phosphoglycerate dehydrogenase
MLGSVTAILAEKGLNIDNMVNRSKGEYAYTMIDVDQNDVSSIEADLSALSSVIRVRILQWL